MKHCCTFLTASWFFSCVVYAQHPVIFTESAQTIGARHVNSGLGVEYFEKHSAPANDLPYNELRAFAAVAQFGAADNVDFTLAWRGALIADYPQGARGYDWGDITVATKISLVNTTGGFPRLGILTSVKLPNTSYAPYKLGSDQTDFFFHALASGTVGEVETRINLGFAIVGDPTAPGSQNDVYMFGAACLVLVSKNIKIFGEANGVKGYLSGDGKLVTRAGVLTSFGSLNVSAYGSVRALGDNRDFGTAFELSENWSIGLFFSREFWW